MYTISSFCEVFQELNKLLNSFLCNKYNLLKIFHLYFVLIYALCIVYLRPIRLILNLGQNGILFLSAIFALQNKPF